MKRLTLVLAVAFTLAGTSRAQIVTYNFAGAAGNQASTSASGVASGLTASVFTRGSGVTAKVKSNSINSKVGRPAPSTSTIISRSLSRRRAATS